MPALTTYSVLYSYPTSDRNYRGQRGLRVVARDEAHALELIRAGYDGRPKCPGATIVRCEVSRRQAVCSCPPEANYAYECTECPVHGEQARAEVAAEHADEIRAETGGAAYIAPSGEIGI